MNGHVYTNIDALFTGSIFVNVSSNDKHIQNRPKPKNIGLNLKFSKRNEMVINTL